MCGIFGILVGEGSSVTGEFIDSTVVELLRLSESRGQEASGLAVLSEANIRIAKASEAPSAFIKSISYRRLASSWRNRTMGKPLSIIGHSRLVTSGDAAIPENNQPVSTGNTVLVHNGLITNQAELTDGVTSEYAGVDSLLLAEQIDKAQASGASLYDAVRQGIEKITGEASTITIGSQHEEVVLASNTGSLYFYRHDHDQVLVLASERFILQTLVSRLWNIGNATVSRVNPNDVISINWRSLVASNAPPNSAVKPEPGCAVVNLAHRRIEDLITLSNQLRAGVRRCTRCILPETMPYISFDEQGVCSYCNNHQAKSMRPLPELEETLARYRVVGQQDCLVAFSGGRDSCYGLHLLVHELGMNPIAYTYDWGMVTDIARRNQSRMCSSLGVEHLWVSANIREKRRNIRLNLEAWMRKPHLGMIPLFMAGDKQFFYYANRAMKQCNIDLMVFCMNHFERTDFKVGFAGIAPDHERERGYTLGLWNKIALALFYCGEFLGNPSYLNRSMLDTFTAYLSYYFVPQNYIYLFDYFGWDENQINQVLINDYNWETAEDSTSTWRIGDGTAAFYNYVYYTVVGFTEHDVFRSNQIRSGVMDRDEALRLVARENQPRWASIREYATIIGVDYANLLIAADKMSTFYDKVWQD